MVLIGGLRLIVGLTFLGVIIALCVWLLSRLFPATSNAPDNTTPATLRAQQTSDHLKNENTERNDVVQEQSSRNKREYKHKRMPR